MLDFIIFAITALIVLVVAVLYLAPSSKRVTTIPGPDVSDPLEGNVPDIAAAGSIHEFLEDLHGHYGPIVHFWMGPQMTVSIASPELFKQHAAVFDRPPEPFELFRMFITSHSIQYANGSEGRRRHQAYGRCFAHGAIANYFPVFQQLTDQLMSKWRGIPANDHLPLREYMFAFSIKVVLKACYGKHFDNDKMILQLKRSYDIVWGDFEHQVAGDKLEEGSPRMDKLTKEIDNIYDIMRQALSAYREQEHPDGDEKDLMNVITNLDLGDETILADMVCILVASFHTTGLLLTWALYYLALHQDIQDKVVDELKNVLGNKKVTHATSSELVYMRQVLDETLRCSVLAPYAARVQDFESEIGGHIIPKGTPVLHALGVSLTDSSRWPDPEKFDPERFSPENRKQMQSFAFEPFGFAGKRKCMGYLFSYAEATVFLTEVIRNFHVKLVPDQVVTPVYGLVTRPREELWLTIEKRKNEE